MLRTRAFVLPALIGLTTLTVLPPREAAAGFIVNYTVEATGQTATADFSFLDSDTLSIVLTETTPAATSPLTGSAAVLTRLGFHLPGVQIAGGNALITPGSASVGFGLVNPQLGGGTNVSTEWGFSAGASPIGSTSGPLPDVLRAKGLLLLQQSSDASTEANGLNVQYVFFRDRAKQLRDAAALILGSNPDPLMKADAQQLILLAEQDEARAANFQALETAARAKAAQFGDQGQSLIDQADGTLLFDFVGVLADDTTPFATVPPGANLDGPDDLDGAQGGLLADSDERDGLGVIDDSVTITLDLSGPLDEAAREDFLRRLLTDSIVEYGPDTAYAVAGPSVTAVAEPSSLALIAIGGAFAAARSRRRSA